MNMWKLENPNMVFYYQNGDAIGGVFKPLVFKLHGKRQFY